MKKSVKILLSGLFIMCLFLNASVVVNNSSTDVGFDLTSNFAVPLTQLPPDEQEETIPPDDILDGGSIGEATITCSSTRYGPCNALFAFYSEECQFWVFLCDRTGNQAESCYQWEEIVGNCTTVLIEFWKFWKW